MQFIEEKRIDVNVARGDSISINVTVDILGHLIHEEIQTTFDCYASIEFVDIYLLNENDRKELGQTKQLWLEYYDESRNAVRVS